MSALKPPKRIFIVDTGHGFWEFGATRAEAVDQYDSAMATSAKRVPPPTLIAYERVEKKQKRTKGSRR